ncbi:MAG: hypothetical protein N4A53_16775 [Pelagimonas sp.]|jgi:hypothetical protein|nr:hypothetical protein [Pelagimonas sp.]
MTDLHQALAVQALRLVPPDEEGRMHDKASTALQFACMALVAMGVAKERRYGAQLTVPAEEVTRFIDPNGLWIGDAARVFLAIGTQLNDISTQATRDRQQSQPWKPVGGLKAVKQALEDSIAKGAVPEYLPDHAKVRWLEGQKHHLAAILRAEEKVSLPLPAGPLHIHPDFLRPLEAIGWVKKMEWQADASETLWRNGMLQPSDTERADLIVQAQETMPQDVAMVLASVWQPPDWDEIEGRARDWQRTQAEHLARVPEQYRDRQPAPLSKEEICEQIAARWPEDQTRKAIRLFEARWRPSLGWDSAEPRLPLFHDALMQTVVNAVIEQ